MAARPAPVRTCTGCGAKRGKAEMIRVIAGPDGRPVPDLKGRLPARGAYICPRQNCLEKAAGGRLFATLKVQRPVGYTDVDLARATAQALRIRGSSLLGLAMKAGKVVAGTNLVEAEVKRGAEKDWLVLIAEDASAETVRKVEARVREKGIAVHRFLTREETGDAIGKSPRSMILIRDRGFAEEVKQIITRLRAVTDKGGLKG